MKILKNSHAYCLFVICLLFVQCQKGDDAIFILPKGFSGYILLIYNQKGGEIPRYIDNMRLYVIPKDGILRTQFADNDGVSSVQFYFSKKEEEKKIPFHINLKGIHDDQIIASGGIVGSLSVQKSRIYYVKYFIGNKEERKKSENDLNSSKIVEIIKNKLREEGIPSRE